MMKEIKNIQYADCKECVLDLHIPDSESFPVLLYLHGGGLDHSDKNDCTESLAKPLAEKGIAVANANYRMYPKAKYPDFVEDAAAAAAWLFNNIHNYGDCKQIIIGGSSAGGYLAQMLLFDRKYLQKYNLTPESFDGFVLDAGQPTTHFNVLHERGIDTRRVIIDDAAPMYHICESDGNHPYILVVYAENDLPCRPEQTVLMLRLMKEMGYDESKIEVRYMLGNGHCEYTHEKNGQEAEIVEIVRGFISKYVESNAEI